MMIAVVNQKGGVGKSTLTVHIARVLSERGLRVLMVDADPNYGATDHLLTSEPDADLYALWERPLLTRLDDVSVQVGGGVVLLPGSRRTENLGEPRNAAEQLKKTRIGWPDPLPALADRLRGYSRSFDVTLLDTGPSLVAGTRLAYFAADSWLIVGRPHVSSRKGLQRSLEDLELVHGPDAAAHLLGIVLNDVDVRTSCMERYRRDLKPEIAERHFSAGLRSSAAIRHAWADHQTLFDFDPRHAALDDMRAIADELVQRAGMAS